MSTFFFITEQGCKEYAINNWLLGQDGKVLNSNMFRKRNVLDHVLSNQMMSSRDMFFSHHRKVCKVLNLDNKGCTALRACQPQAYARTEWKLAPVILTCDRHPSHSEVIARCSVITYKVS